MSICPENKGDRRERNGDEAEKGRRPVRVEDFVHLCGEKREPRTEHGTDDGHGGERGRGHLEVCVDGVIEEAEEEEDDGAAEGQPREERRPEGDGAVRGPPNPEEGGGEQRGGDHADLEAVLRWHGERRELVHFALVARVEDDEVQDDAHCGADEDGEKGKANESRAKVVDPAEDDGICFK